MNDYNPILTDYENYLSVSRNLSPATVKSYLSNLRQFFRFIKTGLCDPTDNTPIDDIGTDTLAQTEVADFYAFFSASAKDLNNAVATRRRKAAALRSLYHYLTSTVNGFTDPTAALDMPKKEAKEMIYLDLDELKKLLAAADDPRDLAILTLFSHCGLRLAELVNLRLSDIRKTRDGYFLQIKGKGGTVRTVSLDPACMKALRKWLKIRPDSDQCDALFCHRKTKDLVTPLAPRTVQEIFHRTVKKAGIEKEGLTVHKLRHTAATLLHQYGNTDIRTLQKILGHKDIRSTEIYTHVSDLEIRNAMMQHPLAKN